MLLFALMVGVITDNVTQYMEFLKMVYTRARAGARVRVPVHGATQDGMCYAGW